MAERDGYSPGPAFGAEVRKDDPAWTLVLVRDLRHPPAKVWDALTDPAQLREWAPFDADRNLSRPGPAKLVTAGMGQSSETQVRRAEAPRLLEFNWGDQELRWELEPQGTGTRLTLWHSIHKNFISMGAAGWHICFDVLDRWLAGKPLGRLVAQDALDFEGWHRLHAEYAQQFGVKAQDMSRGLPKS